MSIVGTYSSWLPNGFGFGQSVVVDYPGIAAPGDTKPAKPDAAPEPKEPTKRPWAGGPMSWMGQWPGFGATPALTIPICWAMRRYPTTVKVHALLTAPLLAAPRSIEVVNDGGNADLAKKIKDAATAELLPILNRAMPGAMESPHFGHWLQEIVWDRAGSRTVPVDVRTILPGEAVLHVDDRRRFTGYQINGDDWRDSRYAFLCVNDPHVDPVLGYSCNENALSTWFRATKSSENADAVERKAAGIQLLAYIMDGVTFTDKDGKVVEVETLLNKVMNAASQGQSASVPAQAFSKEAIQSKPELAAIPWIKIDKFDWGNIGPSLDAHLNRLRGLNVDIFAAWGVPERAGMESEHGSRADAEAHGGVVLSRSEWLHGNACGQWDAQVTTRWQAANYPKSGVVLRTVPSPLSDPQQTYRQDVFKAKLQATSVDPAIDAAVDWRKLAEQTELPLRSPEDAAIELKRINDQKAADAAAKMKQMQGNGGDSGAPAGGRFAEQQQGAGSNGNGKK